MFPSHYNTQFSHAYLRAQRSRIIAPVHQSTIEQEEEGDRLKYGGYSHKKQNEPFLGTYPGYHGYTNRLQRLDQVVEGFQPLQTRTLSFYKASHLEGLSLFETKRSRLLKIPGVKNAVSHTAKVEPLAVLKKPWYEEPLLYSGESISKSNFSVAFVTGMAKSTSTNKQSSVISSLEDALVPSRYYYNHACLLPAPPTADSYLISVEFTSNMVVCYYGNDKSEAGKKEVVDQSLVGGARVMMNTLVIYQTDKQTYSLSRYCVHRIVYASDQLSTLCQVLQNGVVTLYGLLYILY